MPVRACAGLVRLLCSVPPPALLHLRLLLCAPALSGRSGQGLPVGRVCLVFPHGTVHSAAAQKKPYRAHCAGGGGHG